MEEKHVHFHVTGRQYPHQVSMKLRLLIEGRMNVDQHQVTGAAFNGLVDYSGHAARTYGAGNGGPDGQFVLLTFLPLL